MARPPWFLGIWTGIAVTLVSMLTISNVNHMAPDGLQSALLPSAVLLTLAMCPAVAIYFWYRALLQRELNDIADLALQELHFQFDEPDALSLPPEPTIETDSISADLDASSQLPCYEFDQTLQLENAPIPSDEVYDSAFEREYERLLKASSIVAAHQSDSGSEADSGNAEQPEQIQQLVLEGSVHDSVIGDAPKAHTLSAAQSTVHHDAAAHSQPSQADNAESPPPARPFDTDEFKQAFDTARTRTIDALATAKMSHTLPGSEQEDSHAVAAEHDTGEDTADNANDASSTATTEVPDEERLQNLEAARIEVLIASELLTRERQMKNHFGNIARAAVQAKEDEANSVINRLKDKARDEHRLRLELEKHLRITRRALSVLESDVNNHESAKADELIALERELEEKIKIAAKAESALAREQNLRSEAEQKLIAAKQEVLDARQEARKNTAARARVLATANKAITFARQTTSARSKLESEIQQLKEQIELKQATIASLIETLDNEKSKSREEVSYLSRQLMQKQTELEQKSKSAGNLTSRLVKKVARARAES